MELQTRAAKEVMKRSRRKELHIGVAQGIPNLGCKRSWNKELETQIAERSSQTQPQKDDDEAGHAENNLFSAPLLDCFWPRCYGDLYLSLFFMEECFQTS